MALAAVETLVRPSDLEGTIEIVLASPASRTFPPRLTDSLGICLKIGGSHSVRSDGRWLDYPANSVCIRPPGCVWSTAATGPVGFVSLDIAPDVLPETIGRGRMVFVGAGELPDVGALARLLLSHASRLQKDEAVSNLVSRVSDRGVVGCREPLDRAVSPVALERARSYLDAALEANPSLDDVARASGMNKHVLVRHFRERFGATPHSYLVMAKIARAKGMLSCGAAAADVATTLGFADQAHLTRTFRTSVGLPPAAYQRRVRTVL